MLSKINPDPKNGFAYIKRVENKTISDPLKHQRDTRPTRMPV